MLLVTLFLIGLYASTASGQGFVCGFGLDAKEATGQFHFQNPTFYRSGTIRPVILFGKFKGDEDPLVLTKLKDREGVENQSSADILDPEHVGSLAHYFKEMSYGALTLESTSNGVEGIWFESDSTSLSGYGINSSEDCSMRLTATMQFSREVIASADDSLNFSAYDRDDDGVVDLVAILRPRAFGDTCGSLGTIFDLNYPTNDVDENGDSLRVQTVITSDYRVSLPFSVGVLAHEYGHAMGLPDLYDTSFDTTDASSYPQTR